jgi:hypothetical protein
VVVTCSGCGLRSCDGRCFDESDPQEVEFWENLKLLSEKYGPLTEVRGDPFLEEKRDAA